MRDTLDCTDRSVWKGAAAGLVGGLVASWVMNEFQTGLSKAAEAGAARNADSGDRTESSPPQGESEDATMKAAEAISETLADRRLTKEQKKTAGPIVHYTFGSSVGAVYGALAEVTAPMPTWWGLPFGAAVWVGADEVAVPAFGLSKSPLEYPASTHASALAAHLVYGVTTDVVRRVVRAAL
jgi:putative membrane protein